MTVNNHGATQQTGPSLPDGSTAREVAGESRSRGNSVSSLGAGSWYVPSQGGLDGNSASRALQAVSSLVPPDGGAWQGSGDERSMRRFLDALSRKVASSALSAHAAYHYLLNRCLSPMLAEEVNDNCPAAAAGDYAAACAEAGEYLMEAFKATNRPSRFSEKAESLAWGRHAVDYDSYRHCFQKLVREAQLLGMTMTEDNQRRLFLKGLPVKLGRICEERHYYDDDLPLLTLMQRVEAICLRDMKMFVKEGSDTKAVKVASLGAEAGGASDGKGDWNPKCFGCGELGHIKRNCPKKQAKVASAADGKAVESNPVIDAKDGQAREGIAWSLGSIRLCGAGVVKSSTSPLVELEISSTRDERASVMRTVLLDTGAQLSLCTRAFADDLYKAKIVADDDIKRGSQHKILLADETHVLKDLGCVKVVIEGMEVYVTVVEGGLCAPLIVGFPEICRSRRLLERLVSRATQAHPEQDLVEPQMDTSQANDFACMGAFAEDYSARALEEIPSEEHCTWPPIELKWKKGALEGLQPNFRQAMGDARQTEARMAKKNLAMSEAYTAVLRMWEDNGWLQEVDKAEVRYCLRHFGVVKDPEGLTPMSRCRVVVDGSGLTPLLDTDACLHTDIVRNMLLFRSADYWCVLDVSQAYMRVKLSERDTYFLCIYYRGRFLRFRSLPMGISPSAQILQGIVDSFVSEYIREVSVEGVTVNIAAYMDDLCQLGWNVSASGSARGAAEVETEMEAKLTLHLDQKRMKVSSNKSLNSKAEKGSLLGLRLSGNLIAPAAKFAKLPRGDGSDGELRLTRRQAVGVLSQFFDPLGLFVELSMLSRLICSKFGGLPWDGLVPSKDVAEINRWAQGCKTAAALWQPRKLVTDEWFVFTDASHEGYAAMIVCQDESGNWRRLIARARTYKQYQKQWVRASSKIELLALQMGVELVHYVSRVFQDTPDRCRPRRIVFGTDNETVLNRFQSMSFESIVDRWERKVSLTVNNSLAKLDAWVYHVRGDLNPSDAASRGMWKGEVDHCPAVNSFKEERAVRPIKCVTEQEEICAEHAEQGGSDSLGICLGAIQSVEGPTLSLDERFLTESAGEGQTRQEWLRVHQEEDAKFAELCAKRTLELSSEGLWVARFRQSLSGEWMWPVFIPMMLVANVLVSVHDRCGHFGVFKTIARARNEFFWPGMAKQIRRHVLQCSICQQLNGAREWNTEPQPVGVDGAAWTVVGADTVSGFGSHHKILTISCLYTRYAFALLIPRETAKWVCKAVQGVFALEGSPRVMVTDNAEVFRSEQFQNFLKTWRVVHRLTPRYSPWYGGFYESTHKCLVKTLAGLLLETGTDDWKRTLALATYMYNCRPYDHSVDSGLNPHEVFRGRKIDSIWRNGALDIDECLRLTDDVEGTTALAIEDRRRILGWYEEVWKEMRKASAKEVLRRQKAPVGLRVGSSVYVYVPRLRRRKTDPKWEGPFTVEERVSAVKWKINGKVEHAYNLKLAQNEADLVSASDTRNGGAVSLPGRRVRLAALLAYWPRGELLEFI